MNWIYPGNPRSDLSPFIKPFKFTDIINYCIFISYGYRILNSIHCGDGRIVVDRACKTLSEKLLFSLIIDKVTGDNFDSRKIHFSVTHVDGFSGWLTFFFSRLGSKKNENISLYVWSIELFTEIIKNYNKYNK